MVRVGILGASGYMGGEALRVLWEHPDVEVAWATSRTPGPVERHHPNLHGCGIELIHPDRITPCDAVFVALPTEAAIGAAAAQVETGARVIDLGAAFRLRDRAAWNQIYGLEHPAWELAQEAVYGLSELHAGDVADARLVANPGCFSSATILALAPLVREGHVDLERIVVDGLSGTAGAGAELDRALHHPEIGNNLVPYQVVGHRHTAEMEQELSALAGTPVRVHFTPSYVPIVRGILALCHAFTEGPVDREALLASYRDFYADSPFVHVYDQPADPADVWRHRPYPWVSSVAGTNHCFIGLEVDPVRGRIVVMSVLDSIGKGGAQAGVENLNLMLGLPRERGLTARGRHPA
jgi:N-acetyl-gamma-glutamyl-phosphate reductase common form